VDIKGPLNALNNRFFHINYLKVIKVAKLMSLDVFGKMLPFILLPFYLKVLTQEEFGQYSLLFQMSIYTAGILSLGVENTWGKFFYDSLMIQDRGKILGTSYFLSFLILITFFILGFIGLYFFNFKAYLSNSGFNLPNGFILLLIPAIYAASITQLSQNFFMLSEKPRVYLMLNFLRIFLGCLLFFVLFKFFDNRGYFRFLLEAVMVFIVILPFTLFSISKFGLGISKRYLKLIVVTSFPFFLNTCAGLFYLLGDKILVQKELGNESLAIYNLCLYLLMPLGFFMVSFNQVWLPEFFKESNLQNNVLSLKAVSKKLFFLFSFGCIIIWLGLVFSIKIGLISISYADTIWIFPLVFIARLMDTLSSVFIGFFLKSNLMWEYMILQLVIGLLMILLNIIFIKQYGLISVVAIAALFGITRYLLIRYLIFAKFVKNIKSNIS
jgi:O-antigen/teichoic acid export membrane protein